jgi:hypothetical protein
MTMLLHPALTRNAALAALTPHDAAGDVEIRLAAAADAPALDRLAGLDSRPPGALHGEILMAEVGGEPVAALSLDDDVLVADPFHHTKPLAALLSLRASQLRHAG